MCTFLLTDGDDDLGIHPAVEVQVAHVFGRDLGNGYLVVVVDHPPSLLENMADIMPTHGGRTHVADECH